jgi:hypothetical protein
VWCAWRAHSSGALFSGENSEDAVAFRKAGNAILKEMGGAVNAGEQLIKMPSFPITLARCA